MTIDHMAWTFLPGYPTDAFALCLHIIGRLTAPIMMFFVVEGYYHTKNLKKYISRMFVFAFISHFAYALMFGKSFIPFQDGILDQTSIMWALALGLVALATVKSTNPKLKPLYKHIIVGFCLVASLCAAWSTPAVLAILYMGIHRGNFKQQMISLVSVIAVYSIVYAIFINLVYGIIHIFVVLAIPLLRRYNGERGKWGGMKWFFYIYYPAHLAILGLIRLVILS